VGLKRVAGLSDPLVMLIWILLGKTPQEAVVNSLLISLALWVALLVAWKVIAVVRMVVDSGRDGLIGTGLFVALCVIALPALQELGSITNGQ
jgi:hypothetical protein